MRAVIGRGERQMTHAYELRYSDGSYCGPYTQLDDAVTAAAIRLGGVQRVDAIGIVSTNDIHGPAVAKVIARFHPVTQRKELWLHLGRNFWKLDAS